MNVFGDNLQETLNGAFQHFFVLLESFVGVSTKILAQLQSKFIDSTNNWSSPISFTPLQFTLLKVLLVLLVITSLLICYAWFVYGRVITEKFVRPSTLKEIEALKLSVAKLKLPKEHSPRI